MNDFFVTAKELALPFPQSFTFLFIRDREGIRTPNPQSRNLIFYPVELRSLFERK